MVGNTYISMIFYNIVGKCSQTSYFWDENCSWPYMDGVLSTSTKGFLKQTITYNLLQLSTQDFERITCE